SISCFLQAEDGIRDFHVTGVQTCALPICADTVGSASARSAPPPHTRRRRCPLADRAHKISPTIEISLTDRWENTTLSCMSPVRQIGRASCREREESWLVVVSVQQWYSSRC